MGTSTGTPYRRTPNLYVIDVDSCGFRNAGPTIRSAKMNVEVFSGNQVTLMLKVPPLKKYSYEHKAGTKIISGERFDESESTQEYHDKGAVASYSQSTDYNTGEGTNTEIVSHGSNKYTKETSSDFGRRGPESLSISDARPDRPTFQLKLNGTEMDISVNINKILDTLQTVKAAIKAIQELVKDWVPQVGFKFEVDAEFFSGALSATWQLIKL